MTKNVFWHFIIVIGFNRKNVKRVKKEETSWLQSIFVIYFVSSKAGTKFSRSKVTILNGIQTVHKAGMKDVWQIKIHQKLLKTCYNYK